MKKYKRIISFVSAAAISAALIPQLVFAENGGIYANYDFEQDEIGAQPAGWSFVTTSGSSISVQKDPVSDSKALKLVIDGTASENSAIVQFDQTVGGKIRVAYDLRMENHSRWSLNTDGYGSVYSGDTRVSRGGLYGNVWYYWGGWNTNTGNNNIAVQNNLNTKKDYFHVDQYYDFEQKTFQIYIDGKQVNSYGKNQNFLFEKDAEEISSMDQIRFVVRANANGSGTAKDGTEENNGVYWIDNLLVETPALEVRSTSVKNNAENVSVKTNEIQLSFSDNIDAATLNADSVQVFQKNTRLGAEDYTLSANENVLSVRFSDQLADLTQYKIVVTTALNQDSGYTTLREDYILSFTTNDSTAGIISDFEADKIGSTPQNGWTFNIPSGSSATVEQDPTPDNPDNKALKLVVGSTGSETSAKFGFDENSSQKITVSYDFRVENHAGNFYDRHFGSVRQGNNALARGMTFGKNLLYFYGTSATQNIGIAGLNADNDYHHVEIAFDLGAKTFKIWVDGTAKTNYDSQTEGIFRFYQDGEIPDNLFFAAVRDASMGGGANGVYWIDNVKIQQTALSVTKTIPEQDEVKVDVRKNKPVILFNGEVDAEHAADFVKVSANGKALSDYTVTAEKNQMQIAIADRLDYETEYQIQISKALNSNNSALLQLKKDYILTFTTIDEESASIIEPVLYQYDGEIKVTDKEQLMINFNDTTENTVIVSYKYRSENHVPNYNTSEFGSVYGKDSAGDSKIAVRTIIYTNSMLTYYGTGDPNANRGTGTATNSDTYHTRQYIIDMTSQSCKIIDDGEEKSTNFAFWAEDIQSLNSLTFRPSGSGSIYWVSDITVEYEHLKISQSDPKNGAIRVDTKKSPVITFSEILDASSVAAESVKLSQNGQELSSADYRVVVSGNTITVTPGRKMTDGDQYKIWLSHKIKGKSGLTLMSPREISFTANLKEPFEIAKKFSGTASPGTALGAEYTIKNCSNSDEQLAVVIFCYDKDQAIVGAAADNKKISAGETVTFMPSISIPEQTAKVIVYVWRAKPDGMLTLNPAAEPYEIN